MSEFTVSIVVCTYNRCGLLQNAIQSLVNQSNQNFEIIIINNNSSDSTGEISLQYCREYPNIHYHNEYNQGLSYARNRGLNEAKGEYIGYIDDDAIAETNWIETAYKVINTYKPDAFGGPIYPYYISEKPAWFKDEYEIRLHQDYSGWLEKNNSMSGSNMFFKKTVLKEIGAFDVNFGMKGDRLIYGGENRPIVKMAENKKKIYYSLDLKVKHIVPEFKMDIGYQMFYALENAFTIFKTNSKYQKLPLESISGELSENISKLRSELNEYSEKYKNEKKNISFEVFFMKTVYHRLHRIGLLTAQYNENKEKKKSLFQKLLTTSPEKIIFIIKHWIKKK